MSIARYTCAHRPGGDRLQNPVPASECPAQYLRGRSWLVHAIKRRQNSTLFLPHPLSTPWQCRLARPRSLSQAAQISQDMLRGGPVACCLNGRSGENLACAGFSGRSGRSRGRPRTPRLQGLRSVPATAVGGSASRRPASQTCRPPRHPPAHVGRTRYLDRGSGVRPREALLTTGMISGRLIGRVTSRPSRECPDRGLGGLGVRPSPGAVPVAPTAGTLVVWTRRSRSAPPSRPSAGDGGRDASRSRTGRVRPPGSVGRERRPRPGSLAIPWAITPSSAGGRSGRRWLRTGGGASRARGGSRPRMACGNGTSPVRHSYRTPVSA